ncbi:hypothetical protein I552_2793 [Mycobacterium xenopi 3993]|nr:hypothetical protein I552_2793 [Mycobacterium xenopi 3993]
MDFSTTEAAQDLGGLVSTIVDAVCTPQHQRELDALEQRFDRELWRKLIDADVLSAAAPESLAAADTGCWSRPRCWLHWAGTGRGAVSGIGDAGRGGAGPIRLRRTTAAVGCAGGQRPENPHRRARRRHG